MDGGADREQPLVLDAEDDEDIAEVPEVSPR
jgi:hypothetical protein